MDERVDDAFDALSDAGDAALALKRRGVGPTHADIVAQCPSATINPATQQAVHPNRVYKVLKEDCYDRDPEFPWRNQHRVSKKALTADARGRRLQWAKSMLPTEHSHNWYYQNLVWTDICNSVLARSAKKANEQTLVRKGGRGGMNGAGADWGGPVWGG